MLAESDNPKSQQQNTGDRSQRAIAKSSQRSIDGGIPECPSELLLDLVEFKDELCRTVASDHARNPPTRVISVDAMTALATAKTVPAMFEN
jgi:hypothetical protein